jgi:hypothetical protein
MKVLFVGESNPLSLINGKIYNVESIEKGSYRIIDETKEDYLYDSDFFEIVEGKGSADDVPHEYPEALKKEYLKKYGLPE